MADQGFRDASHAADGLDQLHLDDGELVLVEECVDLSPGIRGEGIDVVDVGVERADVFLVGGVGGARQREQGLAPEAGLEGEDVPSRKPGDEGNLRAFSTAVAPLTAGKTCPRPVRSRSRPRSSASREELSTPRTGSDLNSSA